MKLAEMDHEQKLQADLPYYLKCDKLDVISRLMPQFNSGSLFLREDGKIDRKRVPIFDGPWCYVCHMGKDCFLNHRIMFPFWRMIHSECQECWKVVVEPRTVEELFKLYDMQIKMNVPSKCGTELHRPNSSKRYGGYFYTNSLLEGKARYKEVREAVDEAISPDVSVILKRACTEYEQEMGDSREWKVTPEQLEVEAVLKDAFVSNVVDYQQARHMIAHNHKKWIHTAYEWNDETYLKFTGGNKMFPDLVTYHT